jgi:uncharacterized protein YqjF (DUF2071 family)
MLSRREFLEFGTAAVTAGTWAAGCTLGVSSAVTEQTSHRPWPMPKAPWLLFMRWQRLLFLHWPVRPEVIRPLIPATIELETFDGWCWLGIVPFDMPAVRPRYLPFPFGFPELNVRTYVNTPGRSGVWFFSLDAASWLAVRAARWMGLPYYDARMTVALHGDIVDYQSVRVHKNAAPAQFSASYRPTGVVYHAAPGTVDHWLTERYSLYGANRPGEPVYGEIHHPQWALQPAEVDLRLNTMTRQIGIELPATKPLCHFAGNQEVIAWPIASLDKSR